MYKTISLCIVALILISGTARGQECPDCASLEAWFAENGDICNYHGNRLHSICELDSECVKWNQRCSAKRDELNACIQRCLSGNTSPPVQSQAPELDQFDRDMAELEREGYDPHSRQQSPQWCQKQRRELKDVGAMGGGRIGLVIAAMGDVMVHRCEGAIEAVEKGTIVWIGDRIVSGNGGRVRVMLADRDDQRDAGPTVVNLASNSEMAFTDFNASLNTYPPTHKSLFDLIKGSIRLIFPGWRGDSQVNVRTGVTICGIRGSEVIVRIEPSNGAVQAGVIEGHAWLGNRESREIRQLGANQWAQDRSTGMGPVQRLSNEQWQNVLAQDGLDLEAPLVEIGGRQCDAAVGKWRWAEGFTYVFSPDGNWRVINGGISGTWSCYVNNEGNTEISLAPAPRSGDWRIRAVVAPDGQSLSGQRENGAAVRAKRVAD